MQVFFSISVKALAFFLRVCVLGNLCSNKKPCVFRRGFGCAFFILRRCEMSFAENLKKARKEAGLTQKQVADALKLDRSAIAQYERGVSMPQLRNIPKICELLKTTSDKLL